MRYGPIAAGMGARETPSPPVDADDADEPPAPVSTLVRVGSRSWGCALSRLTAREYGTRQKGDSRAPRRRIQLQELAERGPPAPVAVVIVLV